MGYDINYKGKLEYKDPQGEIVQFLDEDVRDHPEWNLPEGTFYFIDWDLAWDGEKAYLEHTGAEKSYSGYNQLKTILMNTEAVELYGKIIFVSDYGQVGEIICNGRLISENIIHEGE